MDVSRPNVGEDGVGVGAAGTEVAMRYRAVVRFQGTDLLAYFGAPWIIAGVSRYFNQWTRDYGTEWEDVRRHQPTIRLVPR